MQNSKIQTYVGFSIRSRQTVFGVDDLKCQKRGVHLILIDENLSDGSKKDVLSASEKLHCSVLILDAGELGEYTNKPTVKALGLKNKNLADAILKEAEATGQLKLYSGGLN